MDMPTSKYSKWLIDHESVSIILVLIFSFLVIFIFDVNSTGLMETWTLKTILLYELNAFFLLFVSMLLLGLLLEKRMLLILICFNLLSKLFVFYEWGYSGDLIASITFLAVVLLLPLLIPISLKNLAVNKFKMGTCRIFTVLVLVVLSVVTCYYSVHIDYVYPAF